MIIAVASGKGGTGKTSVAASLVRMWSRPSLAVDLDVEAPNLHLFLKPDLTDRVASTLTVPQVAHPERCIGCNACSDLCAFKAVLVFKDFPVVFPDMCHGCEGCFWACDEGVFVKDVRKLGEVRRGIAALPGGDVPFAMGEQRIGEPMSPPLMRDVLAQVSRHYPDVTDGTRDMIIDAPPGASCPAMTATQPADALLLVTEPTPFGLHDLNIAWEAFCSSGKPVGVVINRAGGAGAEGDAAVEAWCRDRDVPIFARLPYAQDVATAYARQLPMDTVSADYAARLKDLAEKTRALATRALVKEDAFHDL